MPFREDIDLSAILPKQESFSSGSLPTFEEEDENTPIRVGGGATQVSSCTALEPYPSVCWDVNGYYRDLGVFWKASRRELMRAYQDSDGPNSSRLTYVFRQLLDKDIRKEYDCMPPGSVYIDDYVEAELLLLAKREALRRTELGQWTTDEDILGEWGFIFLPEDEEENPGEDLTEESTPGKVVEEIEEEPESPVWPYSFYLLGKSVPSVQRLVDWQKLLLDELRGYPMTFSVGWSDSGSGFKILYHEGRIIFFLQKDSIPSKRIAEMAVKTYMSRFNVLRK